MSILQKILHNKKEVLESAKRTAPLSELKSRIADMGEARPFADAIRRKTGNPLRLVAELKKASPSQGLIREDFDLAKIIAIYNRKPVSAVSVLTEDRYFCGRLDYLDEARQRSEKPLLRKDFIIDEYQVYESRAHHADAILLIAAAMDKHQLHDLYHLARELCLGVLVEVHNWKELDSALVSGADIIGINNRNLSTLDISLDVTFSMLKDIPEDRIIVSESGIKTRSDVELIEATRVDAILVGTIIMKSPDIGRKIDELMRDENHNDRNP